MAQLDNRCGSCFAIKDGPGPCPRCGSDETARNNPHQLPIGTVLKEQYRIGKVLGQGGFGITYLGWDLYLDIPVAIKEYYPSGTVMRESTVTMEVADVSGDDGVRFRNNRDRFMREAKMLARFSQVPEVVQIKNFFLANNTAYIVMEYVEGITLKQYVKQHGGKISVEETLALLGPVIETLSKVHKTGIVHRDISPDNIMLLPGGTAKLLDFGAVRDVTGAEVGKELTKSTEAILKQGYAPIEQYQKKGSLGPWTDVYALCATIYYCLTGEVPPDAPARVLAYEEMDMDATGLNPGQRTALLHGMALRVEDRIQSMDQLHKELFHPDMEPVTASVTPIDLPPVVEKPSAVQPPVSEISVAQPPVEKPEPVKTHISAVAAPPAPPEEPKAPPTKEKKKTNFLLIGILAGVVVVAAIALILLLGGGGSKEQIPETEPVETVGVEILYSSVVPGTDLSWTLDGDGRLVIKGTGAMPTFCLESYPDKYKEGRELPPWIEYAPQINHVILEGEITRVGESAFAGCTELVSVDFGDHVEEIESSAFEETGLTQIVLPDTLTRIGDAAFRRTNLTDVVIPDSVTFIGNGAFADCGNLASVTIGPNTRLCYDEINNIYAWPIFCGEGGEVSGITLKGYSGGIVEDYAGIYSYNFEALGKASFEGMGSIEGSDITWRFDRDTGFLQLDGSGWLGLYGGSYQHNGSNVWANDRVIPWEKYREEILVISIGDGIAGGISPNTFENHVNLDDVYFGKGIEHIDEYAFANTGIDWLHLPDGVGLSRYAFDHCRNLRYAVTPLDLLILPDGVFNQCLNLEELYTASCIGDSGSGNWESNPFNNPDMGDTEMPEKLTIYTAGRYNHPQEFAEALGIPVEQGIDGRTGVLMGICGSTNSANTVYWMLEDNTLRIFGIGGTSFYLNNASAQSYWGDGMRYGFDMDETDFYAYRNEIEHIIVEEGVTHLNSNIFKDMPNLKSIDFGSVTHIASHAIVNCGMEELVFPDTTHTIMKNAVVACPNLQSVEIYNAEEHLGDSICMSCGKLEKLIFYGYAKPGPYFMRGMEGVRILARAQSPMAEFAIKNGIPFGSDIVVVG